jgi:endonuclease IV
MIGFHVTKKFRGADGIIPALEHAAELCGKYKLHPCGQIYVSGPQNYAPTVTREEIAAMADMDMVLVIHGAYVDNPWRVENSPSIENIKYEAKVAAKIGATGVIVHLGKGAFDDAILENTLRALAGVTCRIWFEINAAKPAAHTFETPAKLAALFDRILAIRPRGVGLCIDSAHVWSCGVDLSDGATAAEWCDRVQQVCAARSIPMMIHLNDSDAARGSGVDRHAALLGGNIWSGRRDVFRRFVLWCKSHCELIIIERDEDGIEGDLATLAEILT